MYFELINKLVWYIPIKKLRNTIRELLMLHFKKLDSIEYQIYLQEFRSMVRNNIINLGNEKIINETRKEKLIISLTSYPQRMQTLDVTLYSFLDQTIKPDKIVLWLSYEEFPNLERDIPNHILNMKKFGIEIEFCKNLRSYNKLLYSLKKYPNDIIVVADDDMYYPHDWLKLLYNSYLENKNVVHCHRAIKISFDDKNNPTPYKSWSAIYSQELSYKNFCTGVGGVLYKPSFFYKDVFNEELFLSLCPTEDDMWFWAMIVLNDIKIKVVKNNIRDQLKSISLYNYKNLYDYNQYNNDEPFNNIINHYGDKLKNKLLSDN
ncbi:glycosyltransferase [Brachyspira intermedia]|uniref:glycosyltransferase n=1 Tax=Brachyspira intermedia TaxID=84377 RepID=UPI00300416CF